MYCEELIKAREAIEYKKACEEYARLLKLTGGSDIIKEWSEDKHPRGEDGRFVTSGSGEASPSGANTLDVQGFRSKQKMNNHWGKHGEEFRADGITSAKQLTERALSLIQSATSKTILGHTDKDGTIIRYDTEKNDFVKGDIHKGIYTIFKPETGREYYDSMREEDLKHGGKA